MYSILVFFSLFATVLTTSTPAKRDIQSQIIVDNESKTPVKSLGDKRIILQATSKKLTTIPIQKKDSKNQSKDKDSYNKQNNTEPVDEEKSSDSNSKDEVDEKKTVNTTEDMKKPTDSSDKKKTVTESKTPEPTAIRTSVKPMPTYYIPNNGFSYRSAPINVVFTGLVMWICEYYC